MGYYWEEFNIGDTFKTASVEITTEMVKQFAQLSGDHNPFHVDASLAKETIYQGTIAHGLLIVSLFTGLNRKLGILKDTSMGVIHMEWDFIKPVYVGDIIYFSMEIMDKRETSKMDRGLLKRHISVCREDGPDLYNGIFLNLVKRKPIRGEKNS